MILREKLQYNLEIITHDISIYTMDYPKCMVSNNIIIQRDKNASIHENQQHERADWANSVFKANQQMMDL